VRHRWLSRVISAVIAVLVVAGGAALIRSRMPATSVGQSFHAFVLFHDASRLATGSPVMIAGVRVGEISGMGIAGDLARVELTLRDGLQIPIDSWINKRAESAFGDSYLEILMGDSDVILVNGGQLVHVQEGGSTDTVLRAIARTMPKIDRGLDTAHDVMLDGRRWMEGTLRERAEAADRYLAADYIGSALGRADNAMGRFEDGTTRAADAVADAVPRIERGVTSADRAITNARKNIADFKQSLHDGLQNARDGMDRVDKPIDDATELMTAIDNGSGDDWKGTLGRLVNTPDLADSVEDFTETVSGGVAGLIRFHSSVTGRFEWNVLSQQARVYVSAELNARNDKFFLLELSYDPLGAYPQTALTENPGTSPYTRTISISDDLRFTAQFGKRFGPLQLRAGIKDSTPGLGADVVLRNNQIRLSADVFGDLQSTPDVKLAAAYGIFRGLYILGGVDSLISTPGYLPIRDDPSPVPNEFKSVRYGRDYFFGLMLNFDDRDLATLLRFYGALLLTAL
jgi:phospholipid/cholesterol/gamma-HCH transport system substrate-binding protein